MMMLLNFFYNFLVISHSPLSPQHLRGRRRSNFLVLLHPPFPPAFTGEEEEERQKLFTFSPHALLLS